MRKIQLFACRYGRLRRHWREATEFRTWEFCRGRGGCKTVWASLGVSDVGAAGARPRLAVIRARRWCGCSGLEFRGIFVCDARIGGSKGRRRGRGTVLRQTTPPSATPSGSANLLHHLSDAARESDRRRAGSPRKCAGCRPSRNNAEADIDHNE